MQWPLTSLATSAPWKTPWSSSTSSWKPQIQISLRGWRQSTKRRQDNIWSNNSLLFLVAVISFLMFTFSLFYYCDDLLLLVMIVIIVSSWEFAIILSLAKWNMINIISVLLLLLFIIIFFNCVRCKFCILPQILNGFCTYFEI